MSKKLKIRLIISTVITAVLAIAAGITVWLNDFYPADTVEINKAYQTGRMIEYGDDLKAFEPSEDISYGFIFYPGEKIEYTAYEPLMNYLSDKGVLCLLVKMPFNIAIFGKNSALGLDEIYPEVEHWYIGGHSLGGAMASDFAAENNGFEGVIYLAAYPSKDISKTDMRALSVYGSEDRILNMNRYEKSGSKLPSDFTEKIIEGGNHSGFGFYGKQNGDGDAQITSAKQSYITAEYIAEFILGEQNPTVETGEIFEG